MPSIIRGVDNFDSKTTPDSKLNLLEIEDKISPFNKGFKNFIINGDMRVNQRGQSIYNTTGTYTVDRWFMYTSDTSNVQPVWNKTGNNAFPYIRLEVLNSSSTLTVETRLEYPYQFSGKTLTLSYRLYSGNYIDSNTQIVYSICLNHVGGRTILFTGNSTPGGGDKAITFTMPDLSSYTLNNNSYLEIRPVEIMNKGKVGVLGVTNVQLELGSKATPFEQRLYGLELSLCQRYYQNYWSNNTVQNERALHTRYTSSSTQFFLFDNIQFPTMRSMPTINLSVLNGTSTRVTGVSNNSVIETDWIVYCRTPSTFSIYKGLTTAPVLGSILAFDAELIAEL